MTKRASIDIGSNTVLLLIAEVSEDKIEEIEVEERVTALGRDLDCKKIIHPQSMQDTFDALMDYREIVTKHGLETADTVVTATEAARVASNAKKFFQEIYKKLGFHVHIIKAEGEAYYTLQGIVSGKTENAVIIDIGGASTELIKVSNGMLEKMISLPVGSVRGSDWRAKGCFTERIRYIFSNEQSEIESFQSSHLMGVGGTLTSLMALSKNSTEFNRQDIERSVLRQRDLKICVERTESQSEEQLGEKFPFLGKRVASIKAGGHLAFAIGELLGCQNWKISTRGLRYGVLRDDSIDERFLA